MRFAYRKEFATEPIASALRRRGWETIADEHPEELLARGAADVAFASPLEYGRSIGVVDLALVPNVCIIARGFAGLVKLVFNKGLVSLQSLAVKNPSQAESLVAVMLLAEKHDIDPTIVTAPADATVEQMLALADCALLVGDDAIFNSGANSSVLDVADEWEDAVEWPLPYMVAWGRLGEVPQAALDEIAAARDEAVLTLADYAAQHPQLDAANAFYQRYLRGEVDYVLGDNELAALDAYYRYAFYYSVITDIPTLKFLPDGEPAHFPAQSA